MDKKKLGIGLVIILILMLVISIIVAVQSTNSNIYGNLPGNMSVKNEDYQITEDDRIFKPDNYKYIYPEDITFKEKMLTPGGMLPVAFKDEDGQVYTRKFFPSYGYAMYIPENWQIKEHSNSYLQNIFYLITDQDNLGAIEIAVATQTGVAGKSKTDIMESFRATTAGMEYYFLAGKHKLVTSMYKDAERNIITANDVGFNLEDDDVVLAWYNTPDITFVMEDNPYYYSNPYVINYYVVMDDVAVMVTTIGPKSKSDRMYHLLGAMALNIRELKNQTPTALHYIPERTLKRGDFSLNIPEGYEEGYNGGGGGTRIVCTSDRGSFEYGTEIYLSRGPIKTDGPKELLMDHSITSDIVEMCLQGHPDVPRLTYNNLDYSISFSDDDITELTYRGTKYTKINYIINVKTDSLYKTLGLTETEIKNTIYINKDFNGNYHYINFKYLTSSQSYIDDLAKNVISNLSRN